MAVASAGPYASLRLAPDGQPRQHPTTLASNNDRAQGFHTIKSGPGYYDDDYDKQMCEQKQVAAVLTAKGRIAATY